MDMMGSCMAGMGLLGILVLLAIVAGVVAMTVFLTRALGRGGPTSGSGRVAEDHALATLRERYARGEIGAEEYEDRRGRLTAGHAAWPEAS